MRHIFGRRIEPSQDPRAKELNVELGMNQEESAA